MTKTVNNTQTALNDANLEELLATIAYAPVANLQLADPDLVSYYKDYSKRVIWVNKGIDPSLFSELKLILQWNREDEENNIPVDERKPITVLIDTYGGWVDSAFSFIDVISKSKTPVRTVNMGNCLSAGAIILASGTKGYRYCMPLSTALIHEGSGGSEGSFSQVQAQNENYKHTIEVMKQWMVDHTNIDAKTMKKWSNKEMFLYAEDQLNYGVVDYIVDDLSKIL